MENNNLPQEEQEEKIIALIDEDGNEIEFIHIDTVEHNGKIFVALIPADEDEEDSDEAGQLVLMQIKQGDEGDVLVEIETEEEFNQVSAMFVERLADEFDIV